MLFCPVIDREYQSVGLFHVLNDFGISGSKAGSSPKKVRYEKKLF